MTLADQILSFQRKLRIKVQLPKGVDVMNPYRDKLSMALCELFYRKFYSDNVGRTMILGINPGRFGGGITGIPFTDPVKLETLGISNELAKKRELSADFIYAMIDSCGGPEKFYSRFYFGAVSPLGFVREDKNLNYYDIKGLPALLETFIVKCLNEQMAMGMNQKICFCLGEGENFKFIKHLNKRYPFFENIVALPHPRFIMQYRRKRLTEFIELYKARLFA